MKKLMQYLTQKLERIDRWLCIHLPPKPRHWWQRLWIREDEFHPSLDMDVGIIMELSSETKKEAYYADLARRRDIAHKRDMEVMAHNASTTKAATP